MRSTLDDAHLRTTATYDSLLLLFKRRMRRSGYILTHTHRHTCKQRDTRTPSHLIRFDESVNRISFVSFSLVDTAVAADGHRRV